MSKFRVGDTVRCVVGSYGKHHLTVGQENRVEGLGERCIRVNNSSSFMFNEDRFELVVPHVPKPKFKVGDVVRWAVSTCGSMAYGNEYVVTNTHNYIDGTHNVYVIDDNKQTHCWAGWRFELVTPKPKPKADPTYTVTWKAPVLNGYKSIVDGELSFGTKDEARGFASLFYPEVITTVTPDE